ncbi:hypothetical protein SDC9_17715 [bioreactor metagenome]|uniref:AAA+ ATPase domain-containing protein n=1 Tax=bioreactor metagenome TaxID=1076179 RepID=A0A644TY58_9ZZZZ|nr:AAA family ATPase [Lentimicrobium sp.]MEA5111647.1 AAA family ATPase [Lentimicrobium sp.]
MPLYQSQQFKNEINSSMPDDILKSWEMLKRLSSNFTIENESAKMIDENLHIVIQTYLDQNRDPDQAIISEFSKMLANLEKGGGAPGGGKVDEKQVKAIIEDALKNRKVSSDDLSNELKRLISDTRLISYVLPDAEKGKAPKPAKLRPISIKIIDDLRIGNNVMLIGGAGTGKTYLSKQIANNVWGKPPKVINCSQWTSPTEIIGGFTIDGYQEGKMIEAYRDGHVLLLDEMPKLDPNTAGLLNDALSNTRLSGKDAIIQNAKGDNIEKHPNFACIATGNVYPNSTDIAYAANNKQDLSLLDRFAGSVYFLTKDEKFEKATIGIKFIWQVADRIRDIIEESKWEAQMSLRWMIGARNIFIREWERKHNKRKDGLSAHEGLTFAEYLDKFIGTFTKEQKALISSKINYDDVMYKYKEQLLSEKYETFASEELS